MISYQTRAADTSAKLCQGQNGKRKPELFVLYELGYLEYYGIYILQRTIQTYGTWEGLRVVATCCT